MGDKNNWKCYKEKSQFIKVGGLTSNHLQLEKEKEKEMLTCFTPQL